MTRSTLLVALSLVSSSAWAEESRRPGLDLAANFGAVLPTGEYDDSADVGIGVGFEIGYGFPAGTARLTPGVRLEVTMPGAEEDIDTEAILILAQMRAAYPTRLITPFVELGVGMAAFRTTVFEMEETSAEVGAWRGAAGVENWLDADKALGLYAAFDSLPTEGERLTQLSLAATATWRF